MESTDPDQAPPPGRPPADAAPAGGGRSRGRRTIAVVLVVVASLLAFLAIPALWLDRQALNTDNWTETSSELLENDAIRTEVANYLVDQLYANVDVQGEIAQALPPRAEPLAGLAAGGLQQLADRGVNELLARPLAQQAWETANRTAHELLMRVLEGGGPVVGTTGGEVTLNLQGMLEQAGQRFGLAGQLAGKLPPDAGQITILRSDQLATAQDVADVLDELGTVLVVLALALYALAIWLAAGWRREALRATGLGLAVAGVGALALRSIAGGQVVDALATTEAVRPAAQAAWTIGTSLLVEAATAAIAYGVVIVLAAWLAGPTRVATAARRAAAPFLREPRYAWGAAAAIVLLLIIWGPTPATRSPIPLLALIALLALGVELLRRQTAREFPDATIEGAGERMRAWAAGLRGPR
ncbi:MAG: hypothetical protein GXY03_10875 [Solirubrobacterales bacterium]|nr:hypothetical protein [Solirubrobacterales bacterium]